MQFGHWKISANEITWAGKGANRFTIPTAALTETSTDDLGNSIYKWIMLATEEEWLDQDDLYDLNFAFVFAAAKTNADFDYEIFDQTLEFQFDELDEEEE